jgi:hypothetical protein
VILILEAVGDSRVFSLAKSQSRKERMESLKANRGVRRIFFLLAA